MPELSQKIYLAEVYNRLYEFFGPQRWWPAETAFEVMAGAILTQNTAWSGVKKAIGNLKDAKICLSPSGIKNLPTKALARLIRPAGYYNIKAKRLKNFVRFLSSEYGASLRRISRRETGRLRQELLGINGVGPETCDSILLYALGRPVFVIDAYTKRIFGRHGIFKENAGYEEAQKVFMDNLPANTKLFNEYHALIVRLGKEFCRKSPKCGACPLKGFRRKIVANNIPG